MLTEPAAVVAERDGRSVFTTFNFLTRYARIEGVAHEN